MSSWVVFILFFTVTCVGQTASATCLAPPDTRRRITPQKSASAHPRRDIVPDRQPTGHDDSRLFRRHVRRKLGMPLWYSSLISTTGQLGTILGQKDAAGAGVFLLQDVDLTQYNLLSQLVDFAVFYFIYFILFILL